MRKRRRIEERKTDLTVKELPHTRKHIFLDLLKNQKRQMVSLSMLLFVFLLPLVVDILIFDMFIIGIPADEPNYSFYSYSKSDPIYFHAFDITVGYNIPLKKGKE